MKIGFIVRRLDSLHATYTTTHLALEGLHHGHEVSIIQAGDLLLDTHGDAWARAYRPACVPQDGRSLRASLRFGAALRASLDLRELDLLFIRLHPQAMTGRGEKGVLATALHIASLLKDEGVAVINDPDTLPRAGNKAYLMRLPETARPKTIVTADPAVIKTFLRSLDGPAVLKPAMGFGGASVFYVRRGETANINQYIQTLRRQGYILAQEFVPLARRGDKRALLLFGEPLELAGQVAVYRRASHSGDIRNNMHVGGRRYRTDLNQEERLLLRSLCDPLIEDGILFAGVDLAGGKLLEINVWNPGGIHNINQLYGVNVGAAILDRLQSRLVSRPATAPPALRAGAS